MSYIEIKNYNKALKGQEILKDVNINIEKGYVYGLYGSNGSGKTMLLRAICGLIKADSGYVKVGDKIIGKDVSFPSSVGVMIESPGFWDRYTGFENLQVLASIKSIIGDGEIRKTLKRVGLNPDDKRTYKEYSLGMKQRLGIAQAIMESPELLLLYEPTNALDEDGINKVRSIILEEKQRGATVIMANHNKEDMEILADRVFSVSRGVVSLGEIR
jgi:ABC-2 type transport system ATP-binding protein